ncbi:uncharacterized protein LOC143245236 [Tachypleus tridentatus]|uniref:uncharacterized protein LOC143245236 n=1 Tax=Tachypleus tridentatus TaxID=6853 RepID=UPI003FD0AB97
MSLQRQSSYFEKDRTGGEFYRHFRKLSFIHQIFGAGFWVQMHDGDPHRTSFHVGFSAFLYIVPLSVFTFIQYFIWKILPRMSWMGGTYYHVVISIVSHMVYAGSSMINLFTIAFRSPKFPKYLKNWLMIENKSHLSTKMKKRLRSRTNYLIFFVLLIVFFTSLLSAAGPFPKMINLSFTHWNQFWSVISKITLSLCSGIGTFAAFSVDIWVSFFTTVLEFHFKGIVSRLKGHQSLCLSSQSLQQFLQRERLLYIELVSLCEQTSKLFSPAILVSFVGFTVACCGILYVYINFISEQITEAAPYSMYVCISLHLRCWFICEASSKMAVQANKVVRTVHETNTRGLTSDEKRELQMFLMTTTNIRVHGISASGFFTIGRSLLLSIASLETTYLVILMQIPSITCSNEQPIRNETWR